MTQKRKEQLYWLAALIFTMAVGYVSMRYFWPWWVKWCMVQ